MLGKNVSKQHCLSGPLYLQFKMAANASVLRMQMKPTVIMVRQTDVHKMARVGHWLIMFIKLNMVTYIKHGTVYLIVNQTLSYLSTHFSIYFYLFFRNGKGLLVSFELYKHMP